MAVAAVHSAMVILVHLAVVVRATMRHQLTIMLVRVVRAQTEWGMLVEQETVVVLLLAVVAQAKQAARVRRQTLVVLAVQVEKATSRGRQ